MKTTPCQPPRSFLAAGGLVALGIAIAPVLADDFESGLGQWQATGAWGLTTGRAASPTHAATDSPGAYYANNSNTALSLASGVDLRAFSRPALGFRHFHELEAGYDFGRVEISLDGGASWQPSPLATYTGNLAAMVREQVDLSGFATADNLKIRFRMTTDASVVMDGWYLDDVVIGNAPSPVVLATPSGADLGQTHITLRWGATVDPGFASYVVLRGSQAGFDWRTAKTVATFTDPATVEFTDIAVAPKSIYHYVVMTLNQAGLHSLSNEAVASTPAGVDYPFLDDGEGGPNLWLANQPWALSDESFQSPGHAWSDSPGGNYADGIASQPLTLAAPLDLTAATNPVLTYFHRYALAAGDTANVEVSTNLGASWAVLATYSAGTVAWTQARLPLTTYAGQASVLIRFRLTTNASANADGWQVDDISVAEAPATGAAPAIDQVTSHTLRLTWNANTSLPFSHYAIHRSTTPGVGINSPRVAMITTQSQTTFTDTGLALDTMYYYRIYAVSPYGTYAADSTGESSAQTLNNPLPFTAGFEGDLRSWNMGSDAGTNLWGTSSEVKRSGAAALASSPGASYAQSSNTWAETAVDLRNTEWPVLTFWDRYGLNSGDWLRLEISASGGPTMYTYGTYESSRAAWQRHRVDLSPWKGLGNVKLRFRLVSDGAPTPGEGWFLDDLEVAENPNRNTPLALPFTDGFDDGAASWLLTGWQPSVDAAAFDGTSSLRFGEGGQRMGPDTQQWAVLDRPVVLPAGSNVQATFRLRGMLGHYAYQRLHYSTNGGLAWTELGTVNRNYGFNSNGAWERCQASLAETSATAAQTVRLRFAASCDYRAPAVDISLDKFTLAEMPAAVALATAVPALRSVELTWSQSALGARFVRYELWRSTTANVSVANGQKVFETADPATTTCTDGGLNIGGTYYYRVFTVDDRDTYIPSNELSATTVPVAIPFTDPMDGMANWVSGSNNTTPSTWAVNPDNPHGGSAALATVAVGQYAPSTDSYIESAVDLRGTEWPVLTFWDRYGLGSGDWLRLEISASGGPTMYTYGACESSRAGWQRQRVDLSPWKGLGNVKLRFRLVSDGAPTPGEGWFIDDLEVAENPNRNTPLVLPFTDGFDDGAASWLLTGWQPSADAAAFDGTSSLRFGEGGQRMGPDTQQWAVLDRPVVLPAGSNVQATFRLRGMLGHYAYQRLHYSTNGGLAWTELGAVNRNYGFNSNGAWERCQASLAETSATAAQTVRLRFAASCDYRAPAVDISLDKFTLAEMPAAVALSTAVPALRSVELTWSQSALGARFIRYEVWRSTTANVSVANGQKVFETADPATTTCTDGGLNIGGTYYYRVFTVDDRDTYIPSNELSATTVPVAIPFTDPMDGMANWVSGSNNTTPSTWAVNPDNPHGGSAALATVAVGQYAPSTDSYIESAVDLRGTEWPVLTFWDRYGLGSGDWLRLEISASGGPTMYTYGACESSRAGWQRHRIDLSPWKGLGNVNLRFRLVSDGAPTPGEGWFLDDLGVAENPNRNTPLVLPFTDGFDDGAASWLLTGWLPREDAAAFDGTSSLRFGEGGQRMGPDTQQWAVLDRPVVLPAGSNVQATFRLRGMLGHYAYQRLHYSTNGGLAWTELGTVNRNYGFNSNGAWERCQASLAETSATATQTVRLRFAASCDYRAPAVDISLDKFTLAEMPAAVAMQPITEVAATSMKINWTASDLTTFRRYEIFRSTDANVSNNSALVATLTDRETVSYTDTGLDARVQYFYRVYVVDSRDTYSPSEIVSATTLGVALPFADDFESPVFGWTLTGQWQRQTGVGRNGGSALVDSPGDYLASTDTHARIAVNLANSQWPVLQYWDKHDFAGGSWGRVEISNDNSSWTIVGGVTETRNTWQLQQLDLSPWKGQTRVFIRFRRGTDGQLADGWTIDDLTISDRAVESTYPFFDGFESGTGSWLSNAWTAVVNTPHAGAAAVQDTPDRRNPPDTPNHLVLARELDLTLADSPMLTFFIRGTLGNYSWFRVQYSTNGGSTWSDLSALNRDSGFNSTVWIRQQASLATWKGQKIRLRFVSGSDYRQPACDIFLDNIGIGEAAPGAPAPVTPSENQTVDIVRPTLTVTNAIDYQSDALTHQFEVYSDAALTQLVAQVPSVASGVSSTSWQVDVDLPDHAPYWWRARAADGSNSGPWSSAIVFNINEFNNPPLPILIASPANDSLMIDGNGLLVWSQAADPDLGDQVRDYQIQIDNDPEFGSPEVDVAGITVDATTYGPGFMAAVMLSELSGTESLPSGRWFWRIRARDTRFASGAWSIGYAYFRLPTFYQRYLRSLYPDPQWFRENVSDPEADPDGNGVGVLIEFACGIAPGAEPDGRLPRPVEIERDGLKHQGFEWVRRKNTELKFHLDVSSDLRFWQSDSRAAVEVLGPLDATSERVRIVDPDPVGQHPRRFVRWRVAD